MACKLNPVKRLDDVKFVESHLGYSLFLNIKFRQAQIAIVGLGYVGLPLAIFCHQAGFSRVIGYDCDSGKIENLRQANSYIKHITQDYWDLLAASPRFSPTDSLDALSEADVYVLCLPTPVGAHDEPDLSYVESAFINLAGHLRKGVESNQRKLVILESTTYPGTTDEVLPRLLKQPPYSLNPHTDDPDYFLAFSPEREDPGTGKSGINIPKLVGGINDESTRLATLFYKSAGFETIFPVSSSKVAESAKLLENVFRSVNIALVNELKIVFTKLGIDIWEVLDAASTKPFGFMRFEPGPGIGGHCIPVDPFYLVYKAKEVEEPCLFIELAARVNRDMPNYVVQNVQNALNQRKKSVNGSKIIMFGIAYKANVDDLREAPSLRIISALQQMGADLSYYDPYFPVIPPTRQYPHLASMRSVSESDLLKNTNQYDAVVIVTNHTSVNPSEILRNYDGIVVDTRNCINGLGVNVFKS